MKLRTVAAIGAVALIGAAATLAVKTFLPRRFVSVPLLESGTQLSPSDMAALPAVDVSFLRCGSVTVPELIAAQGSCSFAPCVLAHSAVLIRHPRATFLYDTGLCSDICSFVNTQSLFFRKTLGAFAYEQSLLSHLRLLGIDPAHLDFALLSHLHWDHVGGIPDIPGIPLKINSVEYEAARLGLLDAGGGLVRNLMGNNPVELFDLADPPYEGFRSSLDLLGDGSIVLVPLPGHTAGNTGMFINRSNGQRVFLLGDAAWFLQNYSRPAPMHPILWSRVTSDDATAWQTLLQLHQFWQHHPEIPLIAMHDAAIQEKFMDVEGTRARR